ncbi:hypothetical protein M407DRAFT_89381 [Tulasnella calospora MUT 4182]|uniref:Uncharacterized protein n=1 Tax=Tulasnella calospora MUT 4182 TaxID=1051891 RepID=A0A0C3LKQ5_9AGAM|nr:hypothetical protein M407DRAFT_89381 [Tulasnella calospora MUT 4182]
MTIGRTVVCLSFFDHIKRHHQNKPPSRLFLFCHDAPPPFVLWKCLIKLSALRCTSIEQY